MTLSKFRAMLLAGAVCFTTSIGAPAVAQESAVVDLTKQLIAAVGLDEDSREDAPRVEKQSEIEGASHRQTRMIAPEVDGSPIRLNTFCVSSTGTILAACGGKQMTLVPTASGSYEQKELDQPSCLLEMDHQGKTLNRWDLEFMPSAVNVAPNGDIFVAGDGAIARISKGKIEATGSAPHLGDIEEFTKRAVKQAEEQAKQYAAMFDSQIESLKKRVAKIEETAEEDRSKIQTAQLKAFEQQLEMYESISDQQMAAIKPEAVVKAAKKITSLAVSEQDVFWVCQNIEGSGYSIWRTDHAFENGEEVVKQVVGCCGQMDIQCCDDKLLIAENTSFQVGVYDRDGKSISAFGARDRSSKSGFGSCCNPMNVRALADGTVLTAESSIGHIKRFDLDGKFIGYVGKAKVAGGCKHCALGHDPKTDQYFMMHEDESKILVLGNQADLPAMSEEAKVAAKLNAEFSERLLGTWEMKKDKKTEAATQEVESEDGSVIFVGGGDFDMMFDSMTLHPDGKMEAKGGFSSPGTSFTWAPVEGKKNDLLISIEQDQVEFIKIKFAFGDANKAEVSVDYYGDKSTCAATRTKGCDGKACGEACDKEDASKKISATVVLDDSLEEDEG